MLYETQGQGYIALYIMVAAICSAFFFVCLQGLKRRLQYFKGASFFFDFVGIIFSFLLLFILNLKFNYGIFRIYILLIFLIIFYLSKYLFIILNKIANKLKIKLNKKH